MMAAVDARVKEVEAFNVYFLACCSRCNRDHEISYVEAFENLPGDVYSFRSESANEIEDSESNEG